MVKFSIYFTVLFFLFISCGSNQSDIKEESSIQNAKSTYHLLLFKKEQKLEVWKVNSKYTFLDSFNLKSLQELPIGQFDLSLNIKDKKLLINFPNEFYKTKTFNINSKQIPDIGIDNLPKLFFEKNKTAPISKIIIFPNDNRLGGALLPCFACPHWMAEIYSFLNLKKKDYI